MDVNLKRLARDFFKYQRLLDYSVDSYNEFINHGLDETFLANPIRFKTREGEVFIQFRKNFICPPTMGDLNCGSDPLWPFVCRQDKLDYVANLMVNIEFYLNNKLVDEKKNVYLCHLPVMLGSVLDNLMIYKLERDDDEEVKQMKKESGIPLQQKGTLENPKLFSDVYECSNDPLSYFIMNGMEKVLITQEKLATSQIFVLPDKDKKKDVDAPPRIVAEMRSEGPDGFISLVKVGVVTTAKPKAQYLTVSLPFIANATKEMNIVNLIRLVLILDGDQDSLKSAIDMFESYLGKFVLDGEMEKLIEMTIENAMRYDTDERFISQMMKDFGRAVQEKGSEELEEKNFEANKEDYDLMRSEVEKYFFPHINEENLDAKFSTLAIMTIRLMKSFFGYKDLSNRDHYGMKRLETPGILVHTLFTRLFQNLVKEVATDAPKESDNKFITTMGLINNIKDKISRDLRNSFVLESWGVKNGKQKTGVSQIVSRLSIVATMSDLRRVGTSSGKQSRIMKPRMLDPTQFSVVCGSQIQEGESCGLAKGFSVSTYVTLHQSLESVAKLLGLGTKETLIVDEKDNKHDFMITLNGSFTGYCDGEQVKKLVVQARRSGKIPRDTSVTLAVEADQLEVVKEVKIFTTKGRAVRPLYVVENGKLLFETMGLQEATFGELVKAGTVEYIDVTESEFLLIAITPDKLLTGKPYTHCEIDPSFQFGVAANVMAFPQHNPVPRISYTVGMLKQNISVPMTSYQHRPDTGVKILRYPQKSIVQSEMYKIIGLSQQPGSQIAIVGIMAFGYNQDDAIVVNKRSIENGMFSSDAYDIYTVETDKREELVTTQKHPDFVEGMVPLKRIKYETLLIQSPLDKKYTDEELQQIVGPLGKVLNITQRKTSKGVLVWVYEIKRPLQRQGKFEEREIIRGLDQGDLFPEDFAKQGGEYVKQEVRDNKMVYTVRFPVYIMEETPVKQGDVLAVKTTTTKEGKKVEHNTYMAGKRGVVDRIFRKRGQTNKSVKIRIRTSHFMEVGDKGCAPYAQKGVVGAVIPYEDMPFTSDGMVPDILVNPHALPSRMTIGMLLEILIGKAMTCSKNEGPHIIPEEILKRPILETKKYSKLTAAEKRVFEIIFKDDQVMEKVHSGKDFTIPETAYFGVNNTKGVKIMDLPKEQQKIYNILHRQGRKVEEEEKKEKFCDATAFRKVDMKQVEKELKMMGYQSEGFDVLYSGKTGKRIEARIFMGVCNYMALKHQVEDKMHARDRGKRQPINRQATRGKSNNGGGRFGGMESHAVQAHGATGMLQARLRNDSDIYTTYACQKCGDFCYLNSEADEYVCRMCEDQPVPTKVTIPYSFQMQKNYWMGMGMKTTMQFGESTDVYDVVKKVSKK